MAQLILSALPAADMLRFVNSGTEAAMSAIRLARAATGRDLIVKCIGCYHGHVDGLLVEAGSGALTLGTPSSPGIPDSMANNTLLVHFNDLAGAKAMFEKHGTDIACFAVEPVAGNMGVVPAAEGYLQGLRELCDQYGALLLFDEVMTGFRVAWGGAQVRYNVRPDITCLGKIIGGGLPCAAYAGPRKFMELISPSGRSIRPAPSAAIHWQWPEASPPWKSCSEPGGYEALERHSAMLAEGLIDWAAEHGVPLALNRVGSMLTPFFIKRQGDVVTNFTQATASDTLAYAAFFNAMLDNGRLLGAVAV